ncbi:hypothetical protein AURDEDRAFT_111670 [Auricularia subglabra TFB-10046 SS5]|nr:hypothetical protein AURDEDRAFT_111670 [Auricularia subglabra TFB-10046 SS5]
MSSRNDGNELWFCHECHAETRPLMVPTPHCAACNSDFVERIENSGGEDDPREFMQGGGVPGDVDVFGTLLASLLMGGPPARHAGRTPGGGGGGMRFELHTGGSGGTSSRTFVLGGPNTLGGGQRDDGQPPLLAPFLDDAFRHDFGDERPNTDRLRDGRQRMPMHPLFNPGVLALLSGHPAFAGLHNGQMGDYVLDQESMDQILTQLMEAGNPHRPVPAPEDQISHLPRRKVNVQNYLDANEEMRNRDCAVCKDSLLPSPDSTETEVQLVKLPCVHEFHEDCIVPWLKNSGTCPVCRHQLVAQPAAHDHGPPPQQPHEQRERSDRGTSIPGFRTLGNIASNVYHQLRHSGSSSHPANPDTNNPAHNEPGEPSSSSSAPPQSAGSSSGTFGRRTPSPTADFYPMTPGSGPRQYSPRLPRPGRPGSGGYVFGSSPPRSASPETRRPYAFTPPRDLYNPWDTAPSGSRSPTNPGPGGQRSPRDGARSPGHSRRPSGNGNGNGNSSNRPRSPGGPAFPGGWHDVD